MRGSSPGTVGSWPRASWVFAECPVVVLDHLSETQRRAYLIADNKLAMNAGWDDAVLAAELRDLEQDGLNLTLVGFSDEELEALRECQGAFVRL